MNARRWIKLNLHNIRFFAFFTTSLGFKYFDMSSSSSLATVGHKIFESWSHKYFYGKFPMRFQKLFIHPHSFHNKTTWSEGIGSFISYRIRSHIRDDNITTSPQPLVLDRRGDNNSLRSEYGFYCFLICDVLDKGFRKREIDFYFFEIKTYE